MADKKLIHVRLEYEDAIQSKKDVLSSEMDLLKIIQTMKRYHEIRSEEFRLKIKLYRQIKTLLAEIRRLQKELPKLEIPQILKEHETKEISSKEKHISNDNIESQLIKIQEKLNSLGTNNF